MGFFKKLKDKIFNITEAANKQAVKPTPKPVLKPVKTVDNKKPQALPVSPVAKAKDEKKQKAAIKKVETKINKKIAEQEKKQFVGNKIQKYLFGLKRSSENFADAIKSIQTRHVKLDEAYFEDLEETLILGDISVPLVMRLVSEVKREAKLQNITKPEMIGEIVAEKMYELYTAGPVVKTELNIKPGRINVILVVGVNGVGKTTTIAKLGNRLISEGNKVVIAAADTFRAGAVAQLAIWAERIGAEIVKPKHDNADPGSVVFEAVAKAKAVKADILIVDTAGRLENKVNLMNELAKINKILTREIPDAPHESLLIIDGTTGQNGVLQAKAFKEVTPLSGIVLTKMDGTSKGGIILTIKNEIGIAVKLIGLGEKLDDLQEFDLDAFIYSLTAKLSGATNDRAR